MSDADRAELLAMIREEVRAAVGEMLDAFATRIEAAGTIPSPPPTDEAEADATLEDVLLRRGCKVDPS
jgi:hypothetical protein